MNPWEDPPPPLPDASLFWILKMLYSCSVGKTKGYHFFLEKCYSDWRLELNGEALGTSGWGISLVIV